MSARTRTRGQSGLTLIELLIVTALAAIVLGPVVGVAYTVMHRTKPTKESSEASKQLRTFRTVLADDWASAAQIVVDPPVNGIGWPATNASCNGGGYTVAPTRVRIAIVSSYLVPDDGVNRRLRIQYRETPNADGTIRLDRQVCRHNADGGDQLGAWQLGGRPTDGSLYRDDVQLKRVRALVIPTGHGCNTTTVAPIQACDMNVTVIGADGNRQVPFNPFSPYTSDAQRSTVRLHQMVGPVS